MLHLSMQQLSFDIICLDLHLGDDIHQAQNIGPVTSLSDNCVEMRNQWCKLSRGQVFECFSPIAFTASKKDRGNLRKRMSSKIM